METLFESTTLQVLHEARGSATTWVTFGAAEAGVGAPFAKGFLESRGENAVYVMPKQDHWYQVPDIWPALAAIQPVLTRRIITYGSSMGGFGALAFAKELRADQVIAASPQVSIYPDIVPFDKRWHHRAVEHFSRKDAREGAYGHVTLLYDPLHRLDRRNAELIPAAVRVPVLMSGHNVLEPLRRAGQLRKVIASVADGDFERALISVRSQRAFGHWRRLAMGVRAVERGRQQQALSHFVAAGLEQPDHDYVYECIADSLWSLGKCIEAISCDEVARRLRPQHAGHWIRLGIRLVQMNRPAQSLDLFMEARGIHADVPEIWNGLSIAHRHLGNHVESRRLLIKAIRMGPRFRHWLYDLSLLDKGLQIPKEQTSTPQVNASATCPSRSTS